LQPDYLTISRKNGSKVRKKQKKDTKSRKKKAKNRAVPLTTANSKTFPLPDMYAMANSRLITYKE
jgi:hypothetical protein